MTGFEWLENWRTLNKYGPEGGYDTRMPGRPSYYDGALTNKTFASEVMRYTPEEYHRAGISLLPVQGRTIKWVPEWGPALDKARIQMKLEQSQAAQQAAQSSQAAQDEIMTEADKAAAEVKKRAGRAIGRNATILSAPLGVRPLQTGASGGLLAGTSLQNPLKTLLGN